MTTVREIGWIHNPHDNTLQAVCNDCGWWGPLRLINENTQFLIDQDIDNHKCEYKDD